MKDNILEYFVNHNIDITISKNNSYGLYYNLNISDNKKYYMFMTIDNKDTVTLYTRQCPEGESILGITTNNTIKEICQCVKNLFDVDSYDYIDVSWKELFIEQKLLKRSLEKVFAIETVYHD